jgi:hypothetical protein
MLPKDPRPSFSPKHVLRLSITPESNVSLLQLVLQYPVEELLGCIFIAPQWGRRQLLND